MHSFSNLYSPAQPLATPLSYIPIIKSDHMSPLCAPPTPLLMSLSHPPFFKVTNILYRSKATTNTITLISFGPKNSVQI